MKTGAPVSFATDIRPFFAAHCATCHEPGAKNAPFVDLLSYESAKQLAPSIVKRLRGELPVMPPASLEILTAADFAVVIRWVDSGLLP